MKMKCTSYTCVLLLLLALAAVPRASAQIDQFSYFGSEISMDGLSNITIGQASSQLNAQAVDYRFTALQSGSIQSVRAYLISSPTAGDPPKPKCAYACSTNTNGGELVVQIIPDDGGNPAPQNQALGAASLTGPANANSFYTFTFSPAISVTANTTYHLVWTNPEGTGYSANEQKGTPGSGDFVSVDLIWVGSYQQQSVIQNQLSVLELPTGSATWSSGPWLDISSPSIGHESLMPIVSLVYSSPSGYTQGLGYYQIGSGTTYEVGGTDATHVHATREVMTMPSNNVTVSGINVRLALTAGTGELHAHLEDASGTDIDDCYIASTSFSSTAKYAGCNFSTSHTLLANQTYHIDFEADYPTIYETEPMENGAKVVSPGYGAGTTFPYGHAEYETSFSWSIADPNGGSCTCWDWQFYFNVT